MMIEEWSTKILNSMTPGVGVLVLRFGHISYILKNIYYFFKNLFLYSQAEITQTEGIFLMSKERLSKIVNFITPRAGFLVLGYGQISHMVKMHYICKNFFLFTQT